MNIKGHFVQVSQCTMGRNVKFLLTVEFQHQQLLCLLYFFLFFLSGDAYVTAEHLKGPTPRTKLLTACFSTAGTVGFMLDRGFLLASPLSLP